jgi:hypothetical protein
MLYLEEVSRVTPSATSANGWGVSERRPPSSISIAYSSLCALDGQVPEILRSLGTQWFAREGDPVALLIETDRACSARGSFMRAMFAAVHAPELLTMDPFPGFDSMRGLGGTQMEGPGGLVDAALLVHAPWVTGFSYQRAPGGLLLLLHDGAELGRLDGSGELINAFRPALLSQPYREGLLQSAVSIADTEAFVRWWVAGMDSFLALALDPTLFRDQSGYYLPEHHLGFYTSVARLIASVTAILVYTRRDDFVRRLLFFEALDLLEGFGFGAYDTTLELPRLRTQLDSLRSVPALRPVLPRCERAVDALSDVGEGFFEARRTPDHGLLIRNSDGTESRIVGHRAISQLLTVVRNAGHGFGGILNQDRDLSILAAHDGDLSGDISDVALLHLLTLLNDQTQLERSLARRRY